MMYSWLVGWLVGRVVDWHPFPWFTLKRGQIYIIEHAH